MKLWFRNSYDEERIIAENCDNLEDVCTAIQNFIDECNKRKSPNQRPFVSYYKRLWRQEDGRTCIDVGSHSEFFIWEGIVENE